MKSLLTCSWIEHAPVPLQGSVRIYIREIRSDQINHAIDKC